MIKIMPQINKASKSIFAKEAGPTFCRPDE